MTSVVIEYTFTQHSSGVSGESDGHAGKGGVGGAHDTSSSQKGNRKKKWGKTRENIGQYQNRKYFEG